VRHGDYSAGTDILDILAWLKKIETYLGVVEFFFSLEEGKDA
jgi:hypothetical protein